MAIASKPVSKPATQAELADRFELYTKGIQEPKDVANFVNHVYQKNNSRLPRLIREDFCGTAINCLEWLKTNPQGKAIGVDIDPEPLEWAKHHLLPKYTTSQKANLQLVEKDAKDLVTPNVDALLSLNSSVCYFHERSNLISYLKKCRDSLAKGGLLILELYGGPDAQSTGIDRIPYEDFTIVWEQAGFNAITNESHNHIHFEFPDDSRMEKAFSYHFRLWSMPELLDALKEAGFPHYEIYPIKDDSYTKQPDSLSPVDFMKVNDSWTAYVVANF